MMEVQKTSYRGWLNCYRLTDGTLEMIVTADVGPRIIHFATAGKENFLFVNEDDLGQTGGDEFRFYGGHRLWRAPEDLTLTYHPDNAPVTVDVGVNKVTFTGPVESTTGLQKILTISMDGGIVTLTHQLRNGHDTVIEQFAPWALSMMRTDGCAIVPLPPKVAHEENMLPTQSIVTWGYTDLEDPRWTIASSFIALRQDPALLHSQKIGLTHNSPWMAYVHQACGTFIKHAPEYQAKPYPDMGSGIELFTNGDMLELETLGPLCNLQPGEVVTHTEKWQVIAHETRVPVTKNDVVAFIERLTAVLAD